MRNQVTFRMAFYAFGAAFVLACCAAGTEPTTKSAAPPGRQAAHVNQSRRAASESLLPPSGTLPEDDPSARGDIALSAGRRDPFKLPPPPDGSEGGMMLLSHRPPGVHGLLVSELTLDGVVSENSGHDMIAVVTNSTGRAYFLRENEQLFDGRLTKITSQAAYFMETIRDRKGHESVQQVVKWLNSKPGDAQ
ncbi:MAG TPA: hypothetical protein VGY31_15970 [Terriglobia bacterium]|nr:hypothetical protein [Terriglobia bacterium]